MAERDWRAEDVASRLFVSHRTVTRWLSGKNEPTQSLARALGALFEVDWREFSVAREAA
jgi:transcriptional regulator with XRE-family HTH domain